MDRFIALTAYSLPLYLSDLKSNMDRFIDACYNLLNKQKKNLKSNMDRFIDHLHQCYVALKQLFKIQYG